MCLCVCLCVCVCVTVAWGERPAVSTAPQAAPSDRPSDSRLRHRYALALEAAARLANLNRIDLATRGRLKELILDNDANIMAAVEVFEFDHDADEVCWGGVRGRLVPQSYTGIFHRCWTRSFASPLERRHSVPGVLCGWM